MTDQTRQSDVSTSYNDPQIVIDFIQKVGVHNGSSGQPIMCVQTKPVGDSAGWPPLTMGPFVSKFQQNIENNSSYYISTMLSTGDRNKQSQFGGLAFIILDDVGTKAMPLKDVPLPPTWIVESSKGNYQCGYLFKEPLLDIELSKAILKKLGDMSRKAEVGSKITDEGGALVNKFVRLPWGIRNKKIDGVLDDHPCRLIEWHIDRVYSVDDVIKAFGIKTANKEERALIKVDLKADKTVKALYDEGMVNSVKDDGYLITCPWGDRHSDRPEDLGMYWPVGSNEYPTRRGYKCHHSSCQEMGGDNVANEMRSRGYSIPASPELEYYQTRYIMIRHGKQVGDMFADSKDGFQPTLDFNEFQYENHQIVNAARPNEDPVWITLHAAWLKSRETVRTKGSIYYPGDSNKIVDMNGESYFNLYIERTHVSSNGDSNVYLDHCSHILPEEFDLELFHDWIAFKLQNPSLRSYMFLMIATRDNSASKFGIGRSVLGNILAKVFQSGVETVSFNKFTGRNKDIFNGWCEGSQLIIIPEIKDDSTNRKEAIHAYEQIKEYVDVAPTEMSIRHMRQSSKSAMVYYNVLGFSNHADAINIPKDDRRIYVAKNTDELRSDKAYSQVHALLNDPQELANIYHWYMSRDVSRFEHYRPPEGNAKTRMFELTQSEGEVIIEELMSMLKGDLVVKHHLTIAASELLQEEGLSDDSYEGKFVMKDINNFWKKLPQIMPGSQKGGTMRLNNTKYAVRILRNKEKWQGSLKKSDPRQSGASAELEKNEKININMVNNDKFS
tara:strand:+ start:11623 stop:13968 length:2346 start_codon:yes stop_codon:yes gene_type:complete